MKKKRTCEPIQLSGRVYFKGFLAEIAGSPLPATVLAGDIRLHNVLKSGSRSRYGETVVFAGFFAASVYDGKTWRRLLMRKHAAVDATYIGVIERRDKAHACRRHLISLGGKTATWVEADAGYEVVYKAASSGNGKAAPAPKMAPAATHEPAVETVVGVQKVEPVKSAADELNVEPANTVADEPAVEPVKTVVVPTDKSAAPQTVVPEAQSTDEGTEPPLSDASTAGAKAEVTVSTGSGAGDCVQVQVNVHVHHLAPPARKSGRKSRRKAVHPGQLSLFDDE